MRFFSNEADETDQTKEHDSANETAARPVPQQRAGSPWQQNPGPDQQPVAVGTSAVGDDPDRTDRIPTAASEPAADRTVGFEDGTAKADAADAEAHAADAEAEAADAKAEAAEAKAEAHQDDGHKDDGHKDGHKDDSHKNGAAVDQAIEDRGTFDDPHLTQEIDSAVDEPQHAAEKPITGPATLFPGGDVESLRERWRDIQLRFVDDPKAATGEAAGLVDEAVDKLTEALRDHRGSLSTGTDDTESLRVELRGYRDIMDRLLGL